MVNWKTSEGLIFLLFADSTSGIRDAGISPSMWYEYDPECYTNSSRAEKSSTAISFKIVFSCVKVPLLLEKIIGGEEKNSERRKTRKLQRVQIRPPTFLPSLVRHYWPCLHPPGARTGLLSRNSLRYTLPTHLWSYSGGTGNRKWHKIKWSYWNNYKWRVRRVRWICWWPLSRILWLQEYVIRWLDPQQMNFYIVGQRGVGLLRRKWYTLSF